MNPLELHAILKEIKYKDWEFCYQQDCAYPQKIQDFYLYIEATTADAVTGQQVTWKSRKWRLSEHMTKTEVVSTAFMALRAALEHEAREEFTYKGKRIFGPHIDVDTLLKVADQVDARS